MRLQTSPTAWASDSEINLEDDREFHDFVDSVSVPQHELVAMVSEMEFPEETAAQGDAQDERNGSIRSAAARLTEFQRRFQRGWEQVAAAFSAPSAPNYHPRGLRKLKI